MPIGVFLMDHCKLRKHLMTLGLEIKDKCRVSEETEETPEPVLKNSQVDTK